MFGLRSENDEILIAPTYEGLGWYPAVDEPSGTFLGYKKAGKWGLISNAGKEITSAKYYSITPFSKDLFLVSSKGALSNQLKYGLIDDRGSVQLSIAYFDITLLEGFFRVSEYHQGVLRYGMYNDLFEQILPIDFLEIQKVDQVFAVLDRGGHWYFHNFKGSLIANTKSDQFEIDEPYVFLKKNGAVGLLNSMTGTLVYPTIYKNISISAGEPTADLAKTWLVYDWSLNPLVALSADSISNYGELLVASVNDGQRFYADSLEILADKQLELTKAESGYAIAKTTDRYAVFNYTGKKILEGDSVHFDGSYFFRRVKENWDIFNAYGRKINPYPLEAVMPSQSQYLPVKRAGQWGLLDFSGEQIVPHVYDSIGVGITSSFPAKYVGSWGVINAFGNWVVHPAYESISRIGELYVAEADGKYALISDRGKRLFKTSSDLRPGNASIEVIGEEGKGLITTEGLVIFDPIYEEVRHFGDFYAGTRTEGAVIKNGEGAFVVKLDEGVQKVMDHSEGFFLIKKDGLFGFLDEKGRLRIANRYDSARRFSESMAAINLIGKWGFIDKGEQLVVQPQYTEVSDFKHDRAIVHRDQYGLIDKAGNEILELAFERITRTAEGSYILEDLQGRKGLANDMGEIILYPSFDNMQDVGHGLIIADKNGKKGLYDHAGNLKAGFDYEAIVPGESFLFMSPLKQ